MTTELNSDTHENEVAACPEPLLVDFSGPQCKPCLALMPTAEKLEKNYEGRLRVAKVNGTEHRMLCAKLWVLGLQSFLLYKGGVEVARLVGESISEDDLKTASEKMLE